MRLTIGFSPCPNDTFIFDALINKKIDTDGFEFQPHLEDVQTLNNWAKEKKLDVTKISYGALPLILKNYALLNSGGALGTGVGPLLIAKSNVENLNDFMRQHSVAIPGENTTAHLLFSYAFPAARNKRFMVFNQIEDAVLTGITDAGAIIHENRFTYQDRGLIKLMDLGEYWEQQTQLPIPLGGIVVKKEMDDDAKRKVDSLVKKSVEYALKNYPFISSYVSSHSQEMNEDVMRLHIDLYVNNFSIDLGEKGKKAVQKFLEVYGSMYQPTSERKMFSCSADCLLCLNDSLFRNYFLLHLALQLLL